MSTTNTDAVPFDLTPPTSLPQFAEIVFDREALDKARGLKDPEVHAFRGDDGAALVSVAICGEHGKGRRMILDATTWDRVSTRYGRHWILIVGSGPGYVGTRRAEAGQAAGFTKPKQAVFLSRVITGATGTQVVMFIDANPLNLRDDNLAVVSRRDANVLRFIPLETRSRLLSEARALRA